MYSFRSYEGLIVDAGVLLTPAAYFTVIRYLDVTSYGIYDRGYLRPNLDNLHPKEEFRGGTEVYRGHSCIGQRQSRSRHSTLDLDDKSDCEVGTALFFPTSPTASGAKDSVLDILY